MSEQRYLVTARKYRPQRFDELVAQEHVTETLRNAIRLDRLAHAYLFSGPRGVGKTTAARILAKAINCTSTPEERDAEAEPCRACEQCRTFEEGRSLNVIEIDAASNNRVDDIRDLRETVRIPPQGARRKVYIVDEVHMLSTAAFNALLKTLEEPPPHVLFIFATTEPHKVLPTILSRCQRFDFRRISVPEIVARLSDICKEENIRADEASLLLIARKGDGALRDALSVFDQAVSLCGSDIAYADLVKALGVVDIDRYFEVTGRIAARDMGGMLQLVENAIRAGHDLQEFLAGLTEHLRNLLVARTMENTELIEAAEATRKRYAEAVAPFSEMDLLRLLTLAANAESTLRNSIQPRLKVETILLNMAMVTLGADLREALAKIDRLETAEPERPSPGNADARARASQRPPGKTASATHKTPTPPPLKKQDTPAPRDADRHTPPEDPEPKAAPKAPPSRKEKHPSELAPPATPSPVATPAKSPGSVQQPDTSPSIADTLFGKPLLPRDSISPEETLSAARGQDLVAEVDTAVLETVEADAIVTPDENANPITTVWNDLLEHVKKDKIQVWSMLHRAQPEGYDEGIIHIAVPDDFHRRVLTERADYITGQLKALANVPIHAIQCAVREDMSTPEADGAPETAADFDPYEYMERKRKENPVVREIFDRFGGEPVW